MLYFNCFYGRISKRSLLVGKSQGIRHIRGSGPDKLFLKLKGIYDLGVIHVRDRHHDEAMAELFRAGPSSAVEVQAEVFRDGNADGLAILERQLSKAFATKKSNLRLE